MVGFSAAYMTWTSVALMRNGVEVTATVNHADDDYLDPSYVYVVDDVSYEYSRPLTEPLPDEPAAELTLLVDPSHPSRAAQRRFRDLLGNVLIAWGTAVGLALAVILRPSYAGGLGRSWADGRIIRDDLGTAKDVPAYRPDATSSTTDDADRDGGPFR